MSDNALIRDANDGNAHAFERLVERHYMRIYKMAYSYVGQKAAAEDITQNACIKLANSLDQFRFDAAFTTWLYRLVINTAKDYLKVQNRKHSREGGTLYEDAVMATAPDDQEALAEQREALRAIGDLPDDLRETVILVCWHGLTHKEAAEVLGIKENTVSWRLHEVRKQMKENAKTQEAHHG